MSHPWSSWSASHPNLTPGVLTGDHNTYVPRLSKLPDFSPSHLPHLGGPFYTLEGLEYLIHSPGADLTWKTYTSQSSKGAYLSILLVDEFQYKDFMRTVWIYSLNLEAPWISNILIQTILQNHLQLKKKKKKKAYCLLQNPISTSSIPSPIYYLCLFLKHLHLGKSLVTYTIDVAFWENYFHRLWKSCRRKSVCPGFNIIAGWQVKKAMMMGRMTPQLLVNEWLSFQVPFEASLCFFPFLSSLFHLPKDMLNEVRSDTSDNFSIHTKIKAPVTFEWHGSFMDPFLPCFIPLAEWLRAAVHWRSF